MKYEGLMSVKKKKRMDALIAKCAAGRYPLRTSQTLHHCEVCWGLIVFGERYYDGGYDRRVHEKCVVEHRETVKSLLFGFRYESKGGES